MFNYIIITYLNKKNQVCVKEFDHSLNEDYTMNNNILNIYALENIVMGNYSIDCLIVTPHDLIKLTLTETHIETKKFKNFRLTICENKFSFKAFISYRDHYGIDDKNKVSTLTYSAGVTLPTLTASCSL